MTVDRVGNGAVAGGRGDKPATIFDVAAEAGVSKSTVSNVVRGVTEVSDSTRNRVLDAIERLNYKPNTIARQFVQQRTKILGVLLGDLSNPYYAQMAQVVERAAFGFGYTTMFCNIEGDDEISASGVDALLGHRVAGIVFLAFVARRSHVDEALKSAGVPIVFLGLSEPWGDSVGPQDHAGGRLATEHLLELGHRRIAYVRTPLVERTGDLARYAGYRSAMKRAGADSSPALVWTPGSDTVCVSGATVSLKEALTGPHAPTGLFVSNDIGAVALIGACEPAGLKVPGSLSVVGFDDIALAAVPRISLTTISQPLHFQAERAVNMLLERIENPEIGPRHLRVPVQLVMRGSVAAPPRALRASGPGRTRTPGSRPDRH